MANKDEQKWGFRGSVWGFRATYLHSSALEINGAEHRNFLKKQNRNRIQKGCLQLANA